MSGYDWENESQREGTSFAPRIPPTPDGQTVELEVAKLVFGFGEGDHYQPFVSQNNEPQFAIVYADAEGREGMERYTLTDEHAWRLARVCAGLGMNTAKMRDAGVVPSHFLDEEWANKQLRGRRLRGSVYYRAGKGQNANKEYFNVSPILPQPGRPAPAAPPPQQQQRPAPAATQRQPAQFRTHPPAGNGRAAPAAQPAATAAAAPAFDPDADVNGDDIPF